MTSLLDFSKSSIGKKAIMALTGTCLGFFLLAHLLGNSTTFWGRAAFINYAEHLHSLGVLLHLAEVGLLSVFVLHVSFAVNLYFSNLQARPNRYAVNKSSEDRTIASRTMPYTGVIILLFILVHLKNFHFTDHSISIADIVRNALQQPSLAIFYIVCMIALIFHTSHGFWSITQTLGLNHPKYNGFLKKGALLLSVCGGLIFILIPLAAVTCRTFLQ